MIGILNPGSLANGGEAAPQGNGTLVGNAAIVTDGGNSYLSITEADGWVDVGGDRDPGQDPPTWADLDGNMRIDFDIRVNADLDGWIEPIGKWSVGDGDWFMEGQVQNEGVVLYWRSYYAATGANSRADLFDLPLNDGNWHHVRASREIEGELITTTLDVDNGAYTEVVSAEATIQDNGHSLRFGGVGKYAGESGPLDIDNVTISVPEPSTIVLLGLGGIALFRKRR